MDTVALQKLVDQLESQTRKLAERQSRILPRTAAIMVDSAANQIYLFQGSRLIVQGKCSTGTGLELTDTAGNRTWTFDTPRGYFRVLSKMTDPVWYRPDWAFVEEGEPIPKNPASRAVPDVLGDYALGFGDGYFIHGTLYTRLLGSSVTHGCVRVDDEVLKRIFGAAKPGTPIWIY
jgi:L,D-transpeptidase YbiS